ETVLLALAGGTLGLALASPTLHLLVKFTGRFTTRATEVKLDGSVLLFTLVISVLSGLLFGFAPAFSSGRQVADALKKWSGQATPSRGRQGLRATLVLVQIAVSFVLLVCAGLMLRSFSRLTRVDPGFIPDRVLTMRLNPNFSRYAQPAQLAELEQN